MANCTLADVCGNLPAGSNDAVCPPQIACFTNTVLPNLVVSLVVLIGTVSMFMVITAGFRYILAQGDKKALEGAQKTLTFAVVGLAIVMFSFFILNVIGQTTGVTCLEPLNFFHISGGSVLGFDACSAH